MIGRIVAWAVVEHGTKKQIGEKMIRIGVKWRRGSSAKCRSFVMLLAICIAGSVAVLAEDVAQAKDSPLSIPATHLLGFAETQRNAKGTLSIEGDAIKFQKSGKPAVQVKIASIQDIFVGDQSRQVGGVPMTLGKAALPFGGGRAVSLLAHKKYDTLSLEYLDADSGVHGAIFELPRGQGEVFRNELVGKGARVGGIDNTPTTADRGDLK